MPTKKIITRGPKSKIVASKKVKKKITNKKSLKIHRNEKFKGIYIQYKINIELHEKSVFVIGDYANKYDSSIKKRLNEIYEKIKTKKGKLTVLDLNTLEKYLEMHPQQESLFAKNTIVSIVSLMDNVFSSIFRYYYSNNPERLSIENKSITYAELNEVAKIEDAKTYLLDKEIEKILLNEGIKDRFRILKEDMGITLPDNKEHLDELNKLIKTRNLIVHNSCCADQEYIKKYGSKGMEKGSHIPLNKQYLLDSLALVFYIGGFILQSVQIKYADKKLDDRDFILNDLIHELVKKEKFTYIKELYNASKIFTLTDMTKKMIVINFCIGAKKQGRSKQHIDQILEKEDWSVEDDDLSLYLYALKDQHNMFYSHLKKLIKNNQIRKRELLEWEIFTFYRKKAKFREIIKKVIK